MMKILLNPKLAILNNIILKEGKGPVIPSVSISSSEDNVKQDVNGMKQSLQVLAVYFS